MQVKKTHHVTFKDIIHDESLTRKRMHEQSIKKIHNKKRGAQMGWFWWSGFMEMMARNTKKLTQWAVF